MALGMKKRGALSLTVALMVASGLLHPAFADLMNFYNGHVVKGKLTYVAGDLIYYNTGIGKSGSTHRLNLTNREDVVETYAGHKYIGEVVFVDNMFVELATPVGEQIVKRFWVKNIVLGSPKLLGAPEMIETPTQMLGGSRNVTMSPGMGGYTSCPPCDNPLPSTGTSAGTPTLTPSPTLPSQNPHPAASDTGTTTDENGKPMVRIPAESGLQ